ncbi:hypothetical protein VCRA2114E365_130113 [Vibrio crassostreae]|nr:hypothetical protein VCHA43P273_60219 [Vibrio chagasii]CAK1732330.1 hypothetical protein VCRA2115O371_120034 [Vibrio crassostreae]CAK1745958.1 hypothetical protein VCRA2114O367_130035 [Vibrio crassostreae]CAK1746724.1 hypothetical protein VCRA2113O354_130035 [Vibrio crassostreae]CAK1747541.1 hypothetical protein VCRA2117O376_130034 [Vibrio crassostreae]
MPIFFIIRNMQKTIPINKNNDALMIVIPNGNKVNLKFMIVLMKFYDFFLRV